MTNRSLTTAAALACVLWATAAVAAPPKAATKADASPPAAPAADNAATPTVNLRELAPHLQWYRGMYERIATGFQFIVPTTFHLVESNDARNLEMATGHPDDPDAVAWAVPVTLPVTSPQLWVVRVRWRGDGLIAENSADLDSKQLGEAMSRTPEKRLASSSGAFKAFVEAPQLKGHVVSWVEERAPATGKGAVYDCHAVRLARRGVLEFSIVGVGEPIRKTCMDTLGQFTEKLTFDELHEYPAQPGTSAKASYSLANLVTQTK